jgi:hypothetical protein
LVETADVLDLPLLYMYQKSMESGKIPDDWKKSKRHSYF